MTEKKNIISNNGAVDEELLKKFFADSVRMRIDDNGFAKRVMQRLPEEVDARCYRMYNLWTAVMAAACVVVFFLVDGFDNERKHHPLHSVSGNTCAHNYRKHDS